MAQPEFYGNVLESLLDAKIGGQKYGPSDTNILIESNETIAINNSSHSGTLFMPLVQFITNQEGVFRVEYEVARTKDQYTTLYPAEIVAYVDGIEVYRYEKTAGNDLVYEKKIFDSGYILAGSTFELGIIRVQNKTGAIRNAKVKGVSGAEIIKPKLIVGKGQLISEV